MDRDYANRLCDNAGVPNVPEGIDPLDWLDDNDVFDDQFWGSDSDHAKIIEEIFGKRFAQADNDRNKIRELVSVIEQTHHKVAAIPAEYAKKENYTTVFSGLWGAMSDMPNELSKLTAAGKLCYYRSYGNAEVYYVPASLISICTKAYVGQLRSCMAESAVVEHICGTAATHVESLTDQEFRGVLNGDDCVRAIEDGLIPDVPVTKRERTLTLADRKAYLANR